MPELDSDYAASPWTQEDASSGTPRHCRCCDRLIHVSDDVVRLTDGSVAHSLCLEDAFESGAYL